MKLITPISPISLQDPSTLVADQILLYDQILRDTILRPIVERLSALSPGDLLRVANQARYMIPIAPGTPAYICTLIHQTAMTILRTHHPANPANN